MDAGAVGSQTNGQDAGSAGAAGPRAPEKVTKCVGCGNIFVEDAVFCRKCGLRRGFRDEDEAEEEIVTGKVAVSSKFIESDRRKSRHVQPEDLSMTRKVLFHIHDFLDSSLADASLALVVMVDFLMICLDIDARAVQESTPQYVEVVSTICLAIYAGEFLLKFGFRRWKMFQSKLEILDVCVLFAGFAELILLAAGVPVTEIGLLRMLRVGRMIRLIRVVKGIHYLKELRKLIFMFGSCVKTLFWSFVFCFCVMTVWSMMAVQVIDPIVQRLADETQVFDGCNDCRRSFSSVLRANLTMFKTVVAGDSWGEVAVPVIEAEPMTAIIFIGSLMSLLYGLLQLVVAVVVDSAAELRQNDVLTLAMDLDFEQTKDMESLRTIFEKMDVDHNGELDLKELMDGAESSAEFQSRLRVMDIDKADLVQLFEMLDADSGGSISPDEFTFALSRWTHDSKTASRFIKYIVTQMMVEQRGLRKLVVDLGKRVDRDRSKQRKSTLRDEEGGTGSQNLKNLNSRDTSGNRGDMSTFRAQRQESPNGCDSEKSPLSPLSPLPSLHAYSPKFGNFSDQASKMLPHLADTAIQDHRQAAAALALAIQSSVKALHDSTLAAIEHAQHDLRAAAEAALGEFTEEEIKPITSTSSTSSGPVTSTSKNPDDISVRV